MLQINLNENLKNEHKNTIEMTIAKGDIGATTVFTGKMGGLVNSEKIKKDPKNIKTFSIPLTETETVPETRDDVLYNPLAFSIPLFNELYRQGIEVTYTQDMHNTYTINADVLPGTNNIYLYLRRSEAIGLLSGVILSYLILIILGIYILSRERFFDFIGWSNGEYKINVKTLGLFTIKLFEKTPASSLFIFEALFMLAITPFVLMLEENYAKGTAVLAYYLLIFGILLRLVGQSGIVNRISHLQDFPIIMFLIKAMSIIIMVSSLVVAGYELGGLYGAIASFIPGLLFVVLALIYIKKHFEKGSYTAEL